MEMAVALEKSVVYTSYHCHVIITVITILFL